MQNHTYMNGSKYIFYVVYKLCGGTKFIVNATTRDLLY